MARIPEEEKAQEPSPPSANPAKAKMKLAAIRSQGPAPSGRAGKRGGGKTQWRITGRGKNWRQYTAGDAADLAAKAIAGVKYLTGLINVEQKMFDYNNTNSAVTNGGVVYEIATIPEGSDFNQREGNSVLTQHMELDFYMSPNAQTGSNQFRVMVLRDKFRDTTSAPAASGILEMTGGAYSTLSPLLHYQDTLNASGRRFAVLKDEVFDLNAAVVAATSGGMTTATIGTQKGCRWRIPLHAHMNWDATTGNAAAAFAGALYVLVISNDASNGPSIAFYSRIYYTDN